MAKLTGPSCRAARALLGWSMRDLRDASGVALATITAIESGQDHRASTADRIVQTFADNGVEITNGDATGARLLFQYDRAEAASAFEAIVDAWASAPTPPEKIAAQLDQIELRVGSDQLPGQVAGAVRDLTDERPANYREAVALLRGLLP